MDRSSHGYRAKFVLVLLLFNGITAVGGGLALMTGWIPEQPSWVQHTGFSSLYFPGVVLMAVVGGSSLVAAFAMMKHSAGWQLSSILAGVVMVFWIVAEIASIRGFHFLQVIYFVTGAMVIWWTPGSARTFESPEPIEGSGGEVGNQSDAVVEAVPENGGPQSAIPISKDAEEDGVHRGEQNAHGALLGVGESEDR
jgi:hypothetical protein